MVNQNKCERCGAASYKPVIGRDENGAMKPTGEYQCVGCGLKFKDLDEWRQGARKEGPKLQSLEPKRQ
jgi:DNA-directed RNA polymerase subunit RPC12/RpoP